MPEKILPHLIAQAIELMHEQNYDDRMIKYDVSVWSDFWSSAIQKDMSSTPPHIKRSSSPNSGILLLH